MNHRDVIYLDHNATTPVAPEVLTAMMPYLTEAFGNPSSPHDLGRRAAQAVTTARAQVAALIGAEPAEVVFTSGGTESNNLALRGAAAVAPDDRRRVVTSTVEHPATVQPLAHLASRGWEVTFPRVAGWDLLDACPTVATATGSACHSGVHTPSGAVLAMGLDPVEARGAVRLSLGRDTTEQHVEEAAAALVAAFDGLAARA
ncbi:aminotransferase class V-fold PLP-dependent enzyme [Actinotalea sp. K2]|uniref:aminotransferase class V-fold PLP-dependent enzyme n=1 Tax=Actinotalea sp. K2 TaxID=2939438 RepID=UPI0035A9226A